MEAPLFAQVPSASTNFIRISINSYSLADEGGEKFTLFNISIKTAFSTWEITRRYRQFLALHQELVQKIPSVKLPVLPKRKVLGSSLQPSFVEDRKQALESYLNAVVSIPEVWSCARFIEFLDDSQSFLGIQVQMTRFADRVVFLEGCCAGLQSQLEQTNSLLAIATTCISQLQSRVLQLEKSAGEIDKEGQPGLHETTITTKVPTAPCVAHQILYLSSDCSHQLPVSNDDVNQSPSFKDQALESAVVERVEKEIQLKNDSEVTGQLSHSENFEWVSLAQSLGQFARIEISMGSLGPMFGLEEPSVWDRLVDEIVLMVQPEESQILYRSSVTAFIERNARKALGVHVFDVGLQSIKCFLPNDSLRLSIICRNEKEDASYIRLNEKLCRLSVGIPEDTEPGSEFSEISDWSDSQSDQIIAQHHVTNVSFLTNHNGENRLQCLIDTSLGVEILANRRLDLCLLMFFEDFDRIVGKNHLFKRSLILIRAWWKYEAQLETVNISDMAVTILVCAIFNRHHEHVHHPLQVLFAFLAEYSSLDWRDFVVTLGGPVPYHAYASVDSASFHPRTSQSSPLVSQEMLSQYCSLCQAKDANVDSATPATGDSISDTGAFAPKDSVFEQRSIMIAHPFVATKLNMVANKLSPTDCQNFSVKLVESYDLLKKAIEQTVSDIAARQPHEGVFEVMFTKTVHRFGRAPHSSKASETDFESELSNSFGHSVFGSRANSLSADIVEQRFSSLEGSPLAETWAMSGGFSLLAPDSDLFSVSAPTLLDRVLYANLLLQAQISDSALKQLSVEVLLEKGSLPVGEIGKVLQEATAIVSLSSQLKERFGGLKKFLERFPDEFVLSSDHPFNPHVCLRSMLSAEDLAAVARGDPPMMLRSLAASKARKAKGKPNNTTQSNSRRRPSVPGHIPPPVDLEPAAMFQRSYPTQSRMMQQDTLRRYNSTNSISIEAQYLAHASGTGARRPSSVDNPSYNPRAQPFIPNGHMWP